MGTKNKMISKIYRKIITSNEVKAFMIFEKLDDDLKVIVRRKLDQAGSKHAEDLLKKLPMK